MERSLVEASKFLSLLLRHRPETVALELDEQGWADVDELLARINAHGRPWSRELLEQVVAENDKRRFAFSDDGRRIRASQGHSRAVDLALAPVVPPERLFHGTATRFIESIRATGLQRGKRHHVHLSLDTATATTVGLRHGRVVVLAVRAQAMQAAGHTFYVSANGVWLTHHVPVDYLEFPPVA